MTLHMQFKNRFNCGKFVFCYTDLGLYVSKSAWAMYSYPDSDDNIGEWQVCAYPTTLSDAYSAAAYYDQKN